MTSALTFTAKVKTIPLTQPFIIARGARTETKVVEVKISNGVYTGRGECVPTPRYGECVETVLSDIQCALEALTDIDYQILQRLLPAGAARNAIDCALWDLSAKIKQSSVCKTLSFPTPININTVQTISIDTPARMKGKAEKLAAYKQIKVKLNNKQIVQRLEAVHQGAPNSELLIDANESWTVRLLKSVLPKIDHLPIVLLEQPLKAGEDEQLRSIDCPIPLGADESFHISEDIPRLAQIYDVINIKLDKCGGLTEALNVVNKAREYELDIMIGCMVGTSLSMAPGLIIATQAKFVDLDAPLLIAEDREFGLIIDSGVIKELNPRLWGS